MAKSQAEQRELRRHMMLEEPVARVIPIVAIPMIISMLIDSIYNIADTYFVSQLGMSATAAVGVNDSLLHFMRALALGFGMGASSYISRLLGAKREDEASRVGSTTFFTAIVVLTAIAGLAYIFMSPLTTLLGATESSKPYAMDYARFILLSAPITAGEVTCSQLLRAEGSTKYSMMGMVSGCVINVALDPLFIHTFNMQVAGAALATTISKGISLIVLLLPFLRGKCVLEIRLKLFTPKWYIYKEVARMGIPTFLRTSVMSFATVVTNNVAGDFSDAALAAVSVANKCTRLIGSAIMGFGQGFQPIAGYCWGAKKFGRIRSAFWTCSIIGAVIAVVVGAAMFFLSPTVVTIFTKASDADADEILRIGDLMVRSQCFTLFPHVWVMVINGLFQALGRPIPATVLGLSRQVICLIPCVLILSSLFGVTGLAIAQASADVISMAIAVPMLIKIMNELKRLAKNGEAEVNSELLNGESNV